MNEINQITVVPKGAVIINKKIYVPLNNDDGYIPDNSIIWNNNIYYEFVQGNLSNKEDKSVHKSNSENNVKTKNIKKKIKRETLSVDKSEIKSNNNKIEQSSESEIEKSENINKNNEEAIFKRLNKYYYNIEDNKVMK